MGKLTRRWRIEIDLGQNVYRLVDHNLYTRYLPAATEYGGVQQTIKKIVEMFTVETSRLNRCMYKYFILHVTISYFLQVSN